MIQSHSVLIVDDDHDFADILALNLSDAGYDVAVATDGLSALYAFDNESPSLVTLDLSLPTISGFRLLRLFKHLRPRVPVIVITALDFEEAEDAAWAGADDFVTKPFDPTSLLAKVKYFLQPTQQPAPTETLQRATPTPTLARAGR